MTDIIININTGLDISEPTVTTTTDNAMTAVPKTESAKEGTPKEEMREDTKLVKESPIDESAKIDDSKKMDMTEEEHKKMSSPKTKPAEKNIPNKQVAHPKKELQK
jgi:hypothetical protein